MPNDLWNSSVDPHVLYDLLFEIRSQGSGPIQPRKLRLYWCALLREVWPKLPPLMQSMVKIAEAFSDSVFGVYPKIRTVKELAIVMQRFDGEADDIEEWSCSLNREGWHCQAEHFDLSHFDAKRWQELAFMLHLPFEEIAPAAMAVNAEWHRSDLLRDLFYHPDRKPSFDARWLNEATTELATTIYRKNEFTSMPILADLLEENGCRNHELLNHCRDQGQRHARGCWALELCLKTIPSRQRECWAEEELKSCLSAPG